MVVKVEGAPKIELFVRTINAEFPRQRDGTENGGCPLNLSLRKEGDAKIDDSNPGWGRVGPVEVGAGWGRVGPVEANKTDSNPGWGRVGPVEARAGWGRVGPVEAEASAGWGRIGPVGAEISSGKLKQIVTGLRIREEMGNYLLYDPNTRGVFAANGAAMNLIEVAKSDKATYEQIQTLSDLFGKFYGW